MARQSRLEKQNHRASSRQSRAEDNRDKQQRIFNVSLLEVGSTNPTAGLLGRTRVEPLIGTLYSAARRKRGNRWVAWQSLLFWV